MKLTAIFAATLLSAALAQTPAPQPTEKKADSSAQTKTPKHGKTKRHAKKSAASSPSPASTGGDPTIIANPEKPSTPGQLTPGQTLPVKPQTPVDPIDPTKPNQSPEQPHPNG